MIDNIRVIESANDIGCELDEWLSDWAYHNSPDLASVIQELVNGYYYSTGRAIRILVDNSGSTGEGKI